MRTAIVGGGAAGLSLGLMLEDSIVFETGAVPGGLCRSVRGPVFTFDQGPHILGGIPEAVAWVLANTPIEWAEGVTRNLGFHEGAACAHPFEDPELGRRYMAKMWKANVDDLDPAQLAAQPGRKAGGVSTFRYPASGGYQAITDSWAARLGDRLVLGDHWEWGETRDFERVVWTAPVPGLPYNMLSIATLGIVGNAPPFTAVYVPDEEIPFHRVSVPSSFSSRNAPRGMYLLQAEMSVASGGALPTNLLSALETFAEHLGYTGAVAMVHVMHRSTAYPRPVHHEPAVLPARYVLHGRTGAHRYLNVDGVVAESMRLADELGPVRLSYGPGDDLA